MKNLWKMWGNLKRFMLAGAAAFSLLIPGYAFGAQPQDELDDMTFIEMINSVELGNQSSFIQKFQEKEARSKLMPKFDSQEARKAGFRVENFRNKEVILVTIPASHLFAPNSTELSPKASEYLSPFKRYLKNPDTYRVLLVMHTDNTGSDTYRDEITEKRVDAVFDWFDAQGDDTSFLFPYAMGDEMPLLKNDSQENRNRNRRLEIYLMPGEKMIEMARKGTIDF